MDIGRGIEGAFKFIGAIAIVGTLSTLGLGVYTIVDFFSDDIYETKELVAPDLKIEIINGMSDSTYVYTFKD